MATLKEIINSEKLVLVDFKATWCGPCKTMDPILKSVVDQIDGKARVIKIDVDKSPSAAQAFSVQGVPTLILFKEGEVVWRQSGVVHANDLVSKIEEHA